MICLPGKVGDSLVDFLCLSLAGESTPVTATRRPLGKNQTLAFFQERALERFFGKACSHCSGAQTWLPMMQFLQAVRQVKGPFDYCLPLLLLEALIDCLAEMHAFNQYEIKRLPAAFALIAAAALRPFREAYLRIETRDQVLIRLEQG